tara:strand:+ start:106 stop:1083 length:978 start_codon:yes stop_codon:yes gene_type:complete
MQTIKMVEVTRSDEVESFHHGVAVLINSSGEILKEWGNSDLNIYPRSALKPIQTLNLYKDGIAEAMSLTDEQIAITTASHHAEIFHQEIISNWLKKIDIKEENLSCGHDWPWNLEDKFRAKLEYKNKRKIYHNCSGKHCGHLAVCKHKNLTIENYQDKTHPIQKDLIQLIENLSEYKIKNIGIDGCTLPNPLMPLKKFALAASQLTDSKKLSENADIAKKIFNSCIKFPEFTGGTKSINCILTKLSKGKIFFKNGAEGVFLALIPEIKSALVVKILDGAARAAETAIAGLISELKIIDENELDKIKFREVTNSIGQKIGKMRFVL